MAGLTLDAAALVEYERGNHEVYALLDQAYKTRAQVTIPTVAIAEVWIPGGRLANVARLLKSKEPMIEPLTEPLARRVGELMTRTGVRSIADAIVVASAAQRGDDILTQDQGPSMAALVGGVPNVRLWILP